MRCSNQGRFRHQVRFLQRQFLQDGDLPFTNVLTETIVGQALQATEFAWKDRIYTPLVTLWVFLVQVLSASPRRRMGDSSIGRQCGRAYRRAPVPIARRIIGTHYSLCIQFG
jgi:hypothetical protein